MADKSLILNKQGMAHTVLSLMHEDISPKEVTEMYEFASPELRESFVEGLTWGQEFVQALRRYLEK